MENALPARDIKSCPSLIALAKAADAPARDGADAAGDDAALVAAEEFPEIGGRFRIRRPVEIALRRARWNIDQPLGEVLLERVVFRFTFGQSQIVEQ